MNGSAPQEAPGFHPEIEEAAALPQAHQDAHARLLALQDQLDAAKRLSVPRHQIKGMAQHIADELRAHLLKFHLGPDAESMGMDEAMVAEVVADMADLKRSQVEDMHNQVTDNDRTRAVQEFLMSRAEEITVTFRVNLLPQPSDLRVPSAEELQDLPADVWSNLVRAGMVEVREVLEVKK